MKWLKGRWKSGLLLLSVFVIGIGVGSVGPGSTPEAADVTPAAENVSTVTVAADAVTVIVTEIEPVVQTAEAEPEPEPPRSMQTFSGNGGKTIRVNVPTDSMLYWTNDGSIFQIFDEDFGWTGINSQAGSGDSFIPAGSYTLSVNALGNWTIRIESDS